MSEPDRCNCCLCLISASWEACPTCGALNPNWTPPAIPEWQDMSNAPRDGTPILGWCDHEADPYIQDEASGGLTLYAAHTEGLSHVGNGPNVLVWGGGWADEDCHMPDWWFLKGFDFEITANPIKWMPVPAPPKETDQ